MAKHIAWLLAVPVLMAWPLLGWAFELPDWNPRETQLLGSEQVAVANLPEAYRQTGAEELADISHQLLELSYASLAEQDLQTAYRQAGQAVVIGRVLEDPDLIAPAFYQLANIVATNGELHRAAQYADVMIAESAEYGLRGWWGDAHWMAGYCRLYLQEFKPSLAHHLAALEVYEEEGDSWNAGLTIGNIGALYSYLRQYEDALEYFQRSRLVCEEAGDMTSTANAISNVGAMYANLGQLDLAHESYEEALAIFTALGDAWSEGTIFDNIAQLKNLQGKYGEAAKYYELVIAKRREVGDLRAAGASLNNLGLAQQNVGQYDLALDSFTQSLEMVETAGDMTSYGSALNNIGVTYEMLGLFERALGYYQQCHKIRLDTGDRTGECEALNNIGLAHYNLDQYDLALDYLSRSSAIADELGDPRLQAWALNNTGLVYDMRHQYEKAYELYAQAEGLKRANGDLLGAATSRNNAAMVRFSQGRYDEALDGVEATLSVWEQAGDRHSLLIGLNNLAAIHLQIDQPGKAAESSRRAVALAREQVRQFTWESGLKTGLADELRYAGILQLMAQLEQEQADEAFATVQSIKGVPLLQLLLQVQSVTRDDEARKALDRYRNAQALIQTARDQLLALPGVDQLTAQATDEYGVVDEAQLQALSEQDVNQREYFTGQIERQSAIAADAWDYLRKNDQRLTEIIAVNGLTAGAVKQEVLQPGQVLLEYLVVAEMGTYNLRPEVIILCLPAGGELTIARQPMTMITPDGTADEWIAGLVTQLLGRDAGQSREAGRTLYDLLIGPVAGVIPADSKLLLCPDRMLHAVPFEALTDNAGSYVLDEYPVSYATSATMLSYIPPAVEARDGALVAGLSFGGAEAGAEQDAALQLLLAQRGGDEIRSGLFSRDSFFPLPGVPDEVRDVAGILGTAESLDAAVTEKFLVEEMPGHEVIHLATHGFLHSTPLLNGIVAWLPGEPEDDPAATGNTGYDGFLTMSEIMGLKLNECRLVALSCCHSAEGEIAPGQGVMGLSQGFMYAGAQTVLASLDKVDDAATRELMAAFYLHWYEQGMSKQAALQAAKQQISADSDWQLPRYWAPFVLYGK